MGQEAAGRWPARAAQLTNTHLMGALRAGGKAYPHSENKWGLRTGLNGLLLLHKLYSINTTVQMLLWVTHLQSQES